MQPLIYDVAVSIDGFIAGKNGDISLFPKDGPVVDDYLERLSTYKHAIMGKNSYEFGYKFGLKPGDNPYGHMETIVFSDSIVLPDDRQIEVEGRAGVRRIRELKQNAAGPVYLCGGGIFARWMLDNDLIDIFRLKQAPILLGSGTPLFAGGGLVKSLRETAMKSYASGHIFQEFKPL